MLLRFFSVRFCVSCFAVSITFIDALLSSSKDRSVDDSWFFGNISREETERLLEEDGTMGCFLVRGKQFGTFGHIFIIFLNYNVCVVA